MNNPAYIGVCGKPKDKNVGASAWCAGGSILERYLKKNRLNPKTMVPKNLSLKKSESGDITC